MGENEMRADVLAVAPLVIKNLPDFLCGLIYHAVGYEKKTVILVSVAIRAYTLS